MVVLNGQTALQIRSLISILIFKQVMPDSYNSVGCNVVKKFDHVIDGSKHFWLDPEN